MIRYEKERRLWILEGKESAFTLGLADTVPRGEPLLLSSWHGPRLPSPSDYPAPEMDPGWASFSAPEGLSPETWPAWGGARYGECALKATRSDGLRDARLAFEGFRIDGENLFLSLADSLFGLGVTLEYQVFPDRDLMRCRGRVENRSDRAITLERFLSGLIYPRRDVPYRLTHLVGHWAGETRLVREMLPVGVTCLESRRGFTSHHANPFFALDPRGETEEESGELWFGSLAWSGNWKVSIERDVFGVTRAAAGMNDFDYAETLLPAETTESPWFMFGYTARGFGEMSRRLHAWQRENLPARPAYGGANLRPVLYNSWEATAFAVNEADQTRLARLASRLGVELFVMDDGWFGARNSDRAGLGDWRVNGEKFPRGLAPLIETVRSLGMKFGLWVEPEMVNADSDLFRAHPDWVYAFPARQSTEMRNQLVLNLAIPAVEAYVLESMDRLLSENDISFIKWDLNRSIAEPGTLSDFAGDDGAGQVGKSVWVRHTRALWRIVDTLRERHPRVAFQSCSGGGGRVDLGILERFDQVWPSDNTDALDRLAIQRGFTYPYGAHLMEAWVTGERNWLTGRSIPLRFRFHAAMAGVLGIGEDIAKWDAGEFEEAVGFVGLYKRIRPLVHGGDLFRLSPISGKAEELPFEGLTGLLYASEDRRQAVVFAWLPRDRYAHHVPALSLAGLDPSLVYRAVAESGVPGTPSSPHAAFAPGGAVPIWSLADKPVTGAALCARGAAMGLRGDWASALWVLRAE